MTPEAYFRLPSEAGFRCTSAKSCKHAGSRLPTVQNRTRMRVCVLNAHTREDRINLTRSKA